MSRPFISIGGALALLVLADCAKREAAPRVEPPALQSHTFRDGRTTVTVTCPAVPHQLDSVPLTVTVEDPQGLSISGAAVTVDLTMPDMPMPQNRVLLTPASNGSYAGSARFTMAGHWRVAVSVRSARTDTITHSFETTVAE